MPPLLWIWWIPLCKLWVYWVYVVLKPTSLGQIPVHSLYLGNKDTVKKTTTINQLHENACVATKFPIIALVLGQGAEVWKNTKWGQIIHQACDVEVFLAHTFGRDPYAQLNSSECQRGGERLWWEGRNVTSRCTCSSDMSHNIKCRCREFCEWPPW